MSTAADKFAAASAKFTDASTTIGTYSNDGTDKKTVLEKLAREITEGIELMKAGLDASTTAPAATEGGSKNKKNNKDKDNKDKKSKNNR